MEALPNEIFFLLFSYLNKADILRAFSNLNRRIDSIIIECVRNLDLRKSTECKWLLEYIPYIGSKVEIITCNVGSVIQLFTPPCIYANLHKIILCSPRFRITLNKKGCSPLDIIISCLNILRLCNLYSNNDLEHPLLLKRSFIMKSRNERVRVI